MSERNACDAPKGIGINDGQSANLKSASLKSATREGWVAGAVNWKNSVQWRAKHRQGPWSFLINTGSETRGIVLVAGPPAY
jgi:hypothetical protein